MRQVATWRTLKKAHHLSAEVEGGQIYFARFANRFRSSAEPQEACSNIEVSTSKSEKKIVEIEDNKTAE